MSHRGVVLLAAGRNGRCGEFRNSDQITTDSDDHRSAGGEPISRLTLRRRESEVIQSRAADPAAR